MMNKQDAKKRHTEEEKMGKNKKINEKIAQLEAEKQEWNDKYLRLYSEFDNYRKRTAKEKLEFTKVATESLVRELLSVLDDFDRALNNIPSEAETNIPKSCITA